MADEERLARRWSAAGQRPRVEPESRSIVIGCGAWTSASNAIAIGQSATCFGDSSIAIGSNASFTPPTIVVGLSSGLERGGRGVAVGVGQPGPQTIVIGLGRGGP